MYYGTEFLRISPRHVDRLADCSQSMRQRLQAAQATTTQVLKTIHLGAAPKPQTPNPKPKTPQNPKP